MKKKFDLLEFLGGAVAVILLVAIGALVVGFVFSVWKIAHALPHILSSSRPEVLAAAIATSGTILLGLSVHLFEKMFSKNRDISEAHRPHKIEIYRSFLEKFIGFVQTSKNRNDKQNEAELKKMEKFIHQFNRESILWASPKVLQLYKQFSTKASNDSVRSLEVMDHLLREIRKDLGHSNRGLKKGDLMKVFLSDPEEFDKLFSDK